MHTRRYTVLQQVICVKTEQKKELKPTLPLMQLYFINLMTKFTFIFLSLLPPHSPFSLKPLPSGKRAKQHKQQHSLTKQTYRDNNTRNKNAPAGHLESFGHHFGC